MSDGGGTTRGSFGASGSGGPLGAAASLGSPGSGDSLEFSIGTPAGWFRMPDPSSPAAQTVGIPDWVAAVVAEAGFAGRQADGLARSLERAAAQAARQHRPGRLRLVYLGIPPRPSVQAWASVDLFAANGATPDAFAAALTAADGSEPRPPAVGGRPEVWHREVVRSTLAGFDAVSTHDLLTFAVPAPTVAESADAIGSASATPSNRTIQHRFVATLFVAESAQIVQVQLSTPNLAAFDDLEAVGRSMADSIVVRPVGEHGKGAQAATDAEPVRGGESAPLGDRASGGVSTADRAVS